MPRPTRAGARLRWRSTAGRACPTASTRRDVHPRAPPRARWHVPAPPSSADAMGFGTAEVVCTHAVGPDRFASVCGSLQLTADGQDLRRTGTSSEIMSTYNEPENTRSDTGCGVKVGLQRGWPLWQYPSRAARSHDRVPLRGGPPVKSRLPIRPQRVLSRLAPRTPEHAGKRRRLALFTRRLSV